MMRRFFTRPTIFRVLWGMDSWGHTHLGWFHRPLLNRLCRWCDDRLYDDTDGAPLFVMDYPEEFDE
jgi:hypothetical protein